MNTCQAFLRNTALWNEAIVLVEKRQSSGRFFQLIPSPTKERTYSRTILRHVTWAATISRHHLCDNIIYPQLCLSKT